MGRNGNEIQHLVHQPDLNVSLIINRIASLCRQKNISQVVICPGSRCAPLTLSFLRQPDMTVRTFSDERSAGFIALGIARQTKHAAALVCTSGTAAYNFAPAVAEAFFSEVPLVVFTADRPREWIAQHDGQTIFQSGIFGKHVKRSYDLPQEYAHADDQWAVIRMVNEAINLSMEAPAGPVHINVPLREPLYPRQEEAVSSVPPARIVESLEAVPELTPAAQVEVLQRWDEFHNILVVAGQHDHDPELVKAIDALSRGMNIPFVAEVTGNFHCAESTIRFADAFLGSAGEDLKKSLRPDLLVTFGRGVVSKHLKQFLRRFPANAHWHIQPAGPVADTFQQLSTVLRTTPARFLEILSARKSKGTFEDQKQQNYFNLWEIEERRTRSSLEAWFARPDTGELSLVHKVISALPAHVNLHLANSLSVRYANFVSVAPDRPDVTLYANRGTSGIDGCTSAAVGHSLSGKEMNVLITGDVAFFYDRNAFWHNYAMPNLRVVVLNNHGGAIFKVVEGAEDLPESDEYFVTRQKLNAKNLCEEFGFEYIRLDNKRPDNNRKVANALKNFFDDDGTTKVLELETSAREARDVLKELRQHINKRHEQ